MEHDKNPFSVTTPDGYTYSLSPEVVREHAAIFGYNPESREAKEILTKKLLAATRYLKAENHRRLQTETVKNRTEAILKYENSIIKTRHSLADNMEHIATNVSYYIPTEEVGRILPKDPLQRQKKLESITDWVMQRMTCGDIHGYDVDYDNASAFLHTHIFPELYKSGIQHIGANIRYTIDGINYSIDYDTAQLYAAAHELPVDSYNIALKIKHEFSVADYNAKLAQTRMARYIYKVYQLKTKFYES